MLGRLEAVNNENRDLTARLATADTNRAFLEGRANDQARELEELRRRLSAMEQEREVSDVVKGFTSELVDPNQFAEIVRGITPQLKRRDEAIQAALAKQAELERKIDEMRSDARNEVRQLDQRWLDRSLMKQTPEIATMLQSEPGKAFLAERLPGGRRTRLQELQDAYSDGDDIFITEMVDAWKERSKPAEVHADPVPAITNQVPRAPVPLKKLSEDDVQRAFSQMLEGKMTRAQFKQVQEQYRSG